MQKPPYVDNPQYTCRVAASTNYYSLACTAIARIKKYGKVDLTFLGGPACWQAFLCASWVLDRHNKGKLRYIPGYYTTETPRGERFLGVLHVEAIVPKEELVDFRPYIIGDYEENSNGENDDPKEKRK